VGRKNFVIIVRAEATQLQSDATTQNQGTGASFARYHASCVMRHASQKKRLRGLRNSVTKD